MKNRKMNVSAEIKRIYNGEGRVKANVALTIEGVFVIRGCRLIEGNNGLFISMPSRKNPEGEWYDICFPINNETRLRILDTVTAAYEKALQSHDATAETTEGGKQAVA
ncbi:MAG: SpoVG family protein [Defluviitaleaceae bacterium]|nr:SpoVG family protein [Defluviitaleaceae bacterium]MCL2275177.1 SpoVG family protein [Defluviitaleaceae bacterium]